MRLLQPLLGLAFLFAAACNVSSAPECVDKGDCGDSQACIDNRCEAVECLDSSTCSTGTFCDETAYVCRTGCASADDCLAGEDCDPSAHECKEAACRSALLDCDMGELCNVSTGDCQRDSFNNCGTCDPWDEMMGGQPCGSHGSCVSFDSSGYEGYCLQECSPNYDSCPAGFPCQDIYGDGSHYCFAWCPVAMEQGWL
ncbi:MAG: hypothetical protein JXX28_10310 [Deltaproteobacteria bacterium]|nr:hypothetical protein [Deltaproteobacteria bacterium]